MKSLEILPILNTLSTATFSVPPAVVFRLEPVKVKLKIAGSCEVLVIEIEIEETFGVKFPNGVSPCDREFLRVVDSCDDVARKPKFVVRWRGDWKTGPRSRGGSVDVGSVYLAIAFWDRTKIWMAVELFIMVVLCAQWKIGDGE